MKYFRCGSPRAVACMMLIVAMLVAGERVNAAAQLWGSPAVVADIELATMRGGVMLPDGLNVDIGIDIQTQVNGVLALHTVLSTAAPANDQLRVFSGGPPPASLQNTQISLGTGPLPTLVINRSGASSTLLTSVAPLTPSVVVLNAPTNSWPQYPAETRVNVTANGLPMPTAFGSAQIERTGNTTAVTLMGDGLTIQHLLGDATGVVIANQLNNQTIQSTTVIDVDLHGAWPSISNAMFSVGNLAIAAARRF